MQADQPSVPVDYGRTYSETPSSSSSCADEPITVSFGIGPSSSNEQTEESDEGNEPTPNAQGDHFAFANETDDVQMVHHSDTQKTLQRQETETSQICFSVPLNAQRNSATPPTHNEQRTFEAALTSSSAQGQAQGPNTIRPAVIDGGRARNVNVPYKHVQQGDDPLAPMLPSQQQPVGHYVPPCIERDMVNLQNVRNDSFGAQLQDAFMFQRLPPEEEVIFRKPPKILNGYLFGDMLGEGSYGKVKECLSERTLRRFAIKILKLNKLRRIPNGPANVEREIRILKRLDHINVIKLHDVFRMDDKKKWYLVLDFAVGSIQEILEHAPLKRFPLFQAHQYFKQLIYGLQYLHAAGVIHKDIKPGNLLMALDETLKITDFGVAEELDRFAPTDHCLSAQGTPKFQAPEIASGKSDRFRGYPVDVWASGVTLYNFISGQYPFDGSAILPLYNNIVNQELAMPEGIQLDETLQQLLTAMLTKCPEQRISVDQIRTHAWFRRKQSSVEHERLPITHKQNTDADLPLTVYPCLQQLYGSNTDLSIDCDQTDQDDNRLMAGGEQAQSLHSSASAGVVHTRAAQGNTGTSQSQRNTPKTRSQDNISRKQKHCTLM